MIRTPFRVAIVGSYTRGVDGLRLAYQELVLGGCQVLSPRGTEFNGEKFARLPGESFLSEEEIERSHLSALALSDFIWLHAPDGYVGNSGLFELGFAVAHQKHIFARNNIKNEAALSQFIEQADSVFDVLVRLDSINQPPEIPPPSGRGGRL